MKLTLTRGFKTDVRAPSFRCAVDRGRDLKFELKKAIADHSCPSTAPQRARPERCESQTETPLRSVKRNRPKKHPSQWERPRGWVPAKPRGPRNASALRGVSVSQRSASASVSVPAPVPVPVNVNRGAVTRGEKGTRRFRSTRHGAPRRARRTPPPQRRSLHGPGQASLCVTTSQSRA